MEPAGRGVTREPLRRMMFVEHDPHGDDSGRWDRK